MERNCSLTYTEWGTLEYGKALEQQKALFEANVARKLAGQPTDNTLVLCEHPHVITVGKNGLYSNLLFPEETLKAHDVSLFHTDRGGDITYHGPGQIVGYPIFDLENFGLGLKPYIHRMEEVIIRVLASYGIASERLDGATGVWLDTGKPGKTRKICAIGVRASRHITMHGFALNANTDLNYFNLINPCGFIDKGVTSIERELQEKVDLHQLKERIVRTFEEIFSENREA